MSANPNPYEPSLASLASADQPPSAQPGESTELRYAGFWRRFGAFWIDALILLPLSGVAFVLGEKTRLVYLYWMLPSAVLMLFFNVYLVRRYGGTPGKLLLGMRIALIDGAPVTAKAALLRYIVLFALAQASAIAHIIGSLAMTDELWFSLDYLERSRSLAASSPSWSQPVSVALQVWLWAEFVVLLFNKRRRSHVDFMAGTVVVRRTPSA